MNSADKGIGNIYRQNIYSGDGSFKQIGEFLSQTGSAHFLLVAGASFANSAVKNYLEAQHVPYTVFSGFKSNPTYEDVCQGMDAFQKCGADCIISVGGGSCMDTAKGIKAFLGLVDAGGERPYILQPPRPNRAIRHLAVPTTAGSGSESTRFAVIYYRGEKHSVSHRDILPTDVLLEPMLLRTLPKYHKKSALLDAACQAIESLWAKESTSQSRKYAAQALRIIQKNRHAYIAGDAAADREIMNAANLSGRAINITTTTAPHAMSYKLTSLYGIAHGHAVSLCLPEVWRFMLENPDRCSDPRGRAYMEDCFVRIASLMGAATPQKTVEDFKEMLKDMDIHSPAASCAGDLAVLVNSVDPARLSNNPYTLTAEDLALIYSRILGLS